MNGQFSDLVERLFVIDCRYPYEYEGGHIKVRISLTLMKLHGVVFVWGKFG